VNPRGILDGIWHDMAMGQRYEAVLDGEMQHFPVVDPLRPPLTSHSELVGMG